MPFQSEKQRRFLHANHPEIAKRWEKEYANGGISNHFRRKFAEGSWHPGVGRDKQGYQSSHPSYSGGQGNQGGGGGPKPHSGPTAAELAAAKAATLAAAKASAEAKHKKWLGEQHTKKTKKVKHLKNLNKNKNWLWKGDKLGKKFYKNVDLKKAWDMEKKWGYNPKYTGKGAINIGKNPNIFQKGLGFGKYLTQALTSPGSNISGGTPLMRTLAMQPFKMAARAVPVVGAAITAYDLANAYGKFVKSDLARKEEDPEAYAAEQEEQMGMSAAHGGVARKNYYHGGILDINESEEIISDDGNDIELTAYNAEFDDPKDLSTGVKTLFQAKDGGRIGYAQGWSPGVAAEERAAEKSSGGGQYHGGGADVMAVQSVGHPTGDAEVASQIAADDRQRKQELKDLVATGPGSAEEKYSDYSAEDAGDLGGYTETKRNQLYSARTRTELAEAKRIQLAKIKKMGKAKLIPAVLMFIASGGNISLAMKTFTMSKKDMIDVVRHSLPVMKAKKEHLKALDEYKTALLGQVDILNPNEMKSKIGTNISDITNEINDLTKTPEDDTKGDGPKLPQVVPIGEEIDAYAQGPHRLSAWEQIKANQAKKAMLVEKGIHTEYNPIVDESVTDITMEANRGGLANLFRVKNQ